MPPIGFRRSSKLEHQEDILLEHQEDILLVLRVHF